MTAAAAVDHRIAFEPAPAGLVISRERLIIDVDRELLKMFGATRAVLVSHSFEPWPSLCNSTIPGYG